MNDYRKKYYIAFGQNLDALLKKHKTDVRFLHTMFFIPDKLTEVFLGRNNNFPSEFKNEFD